VKPPDLRNDPWWRKTRLMGLSDSERILMIRSVILIQIMRVRQMDRRTDGQTELPWHIRAIAHTLLRVKTIQEILSKQIMGIKTMPDMWPQVNIMHIHTGALVLPVTTPTDTQPCYGHQRCPGMSLG